MIVCMNIFTVVEVCFGNMKLFAAKKCKVKISKDEENDSNH